MSLKQDSSGLQKPDAIELTTRLAQRQLFSRFVVTLVICFILIQGIVTALLIYQQHVEAKKMMASMKIEYQRLLIFESNAKLEHVATSYPAKLRDNAMSIIRQNDKGEQSLVAGIEMNETPIPLANYLQSESHWIDFLNYQRYLTIKLSTEENTDDLDAKSNEAIVEYWLVLHIPIKLEALVEKWLLVAGVLTLLSVFICLIVWRLLRVTLLPLHTLARGLDKHQHWQQDELELDGTDCFEEKSMLKHKKGLGALNQSVNQTMIHLKGANKSMSNTLDAIAHDLRTPLSRVLLTAEKALMPEIEEQDESVDDRFTRKNAILRSALSDCAESASQANQMLTTLMKINDEVIGRHEIIKESVSLNALLLNVLSWYEEIAEDKGISIELRKRSDIKCITDPNRLTQILVNLVDNSIKYSEQGDEIILDFSEDDSSIYIRVSDTGLGIEESKHEAIFERLYRVDHSRSKTGYGLGLAMVKVMLASLNASIGLKSQLGQGSEFCIRLPKR